MAESRRRQQAKTPKNTDKRTFSEQEIREGFAELAPGLDIDALLADPTNKELSRLLAATITKRQIIESYVRAYKSRPDEPVPYYLSELKRLVRLDAEIVGNLGEREVVVPPDPVAALLAMVGMTREEGLELVKDLPRLADGRKEKVIDVG